jgi:branched-chain amino acid transport system permease protein/urea transport system permease protein
MTARPIGIAVFALLALAPLLVGAYALAQLTLYVIYGMLAMSLALIWGRAGLLCFGQAMFFGIGAYAMAISTKGMAGEALASTYLGLLLAIGAAGLFAAVLGYFLFWGRGLSGPYLAIVTLAIALILERLLNNWYALGGYNGLLDVPPLTFATLGVGDEYWDPASQFYVILAITAAAYLGLEALLRSPFGILLSAIKTDPERAAFFGYRVMGLRVLVLAIGAGIAGLAGGLFAAVEGFVSPTLIGFLLSTEVLIWVALGGREVLLAAFLGAIAVRWIESSLADLFGDYWILALGLVLMASVVLLPKGLIATPLERLGRR